MDAEGAGHFVGGGNIDDLDQGGSDALTGFPGGDVIGLAGDEQPGQPVAAGKGKDEIETSGGIAVALPGRLDAVSDVAGVSQFRVPVADPEIEVSHDGPVRSEHVKAISGDIAFARVGRIRAGRKEAEVTVFQPAGVKKREVVGHLGSNVADAPLPGHRGPSGTE